MIIYSYKTRQDKVHVTDKEKNYKFVRMEFSLKICMTDPNLAVANFHEALSLLNHLLSLESLKTAICLLNAVYSCSFDLTARKLVLVTTICLNNFKS